MQHSPARRALAGSVLVLGSVGTVSAVHLESLSVPSGPDGQSATAMAPTSTPAPAVRPAAPESASGGPVLSAPILSAPAQAPSRGARSTTRRSTATADRPVTGRDLIDMARGPRAGSVTVPAHASTRDIERTVPLRATSRSGRPHGLGTGIRSFDDLLDLGQDRSGGRWHRDEDRGFDGSSSRGTDSGYGTDSDTDDFTSGDADRGYSDRGDFDTADFGWATADHYRTARTGVGYHQADLRWDPSDVSYARGRCGGRHRA